MSTNALEDLHDADPSGPVAVDADGRSAQTFLVEVVARSADLERRAVASGQDIYAVTAPMVVEAAVRILAGTGDAAGVASVGARFDPKDFLERAQPGAPDPRLTATVSRPTARCGPVGSRRGWSAVAAARPPTARPGC